MTEKEQQREDSPPLTLDQAEKQGEVPVHNWLCPLKRQVIEVPPARCQIDPVENCPRPPSLACLDTRFQCRGMSRGALRHR